MSGGKAEGPFHSSMMTERSQRKPVSPFKQPKKEIVVPNPSDRVVHRQLYEFLRAEKVRRDRQQEDDPEEQKLYEKVDRQLKEFQDAELQQEKL